MIASLPRRQVAVLALGTFAIGTDGFVIAGVLPGIAHDAHVGLAAAGYLVTGFALVYAVAAPVLAAAVARVDRRTVLVCGMAVLAVANLAGAASHGYGQLMAARVAAAVGAAAYSPVAMATGVQLSPVAVRGRAVALVLGGMTVSLVVGVPLGALLGEIGSWRWTLTLVGVLAAVCAVGVAGLLPSVAASPVSSLSERLRLLRQPTVAVSLTATFLWITGAFVLYTFVTTVLAAATGWHGRAVGALLLVYGASAVVGNVAGGRLADGWGPQPTIVAGLMSLVVSMSGLGWAAHLGPPVGRVLCVLFLVAWPLAGWALTPAQSHRLVQAAPAAGPEVLSLNTSAVYLGIASGAALGGFVLRHADVSWLGVTAAALQVLALLTVAPRLLEPTRNAHSECVPVHGRGVNDASAAVVTKTTRTSPGPAVAGPFPLINPPIEKAL